jgi:large subunit ribosomal protein L9
MKLLLRKNVTKLGIVGDIVEVADGYARNYLLPQGVAIQPTEANIRALAEARRIAEKEREERRAALRAMADRIEGIEVTVAARANEEGVLYGSVGKKEIAAALSAEGHDVTEEQVLLKEPIRRLDNVSVDVELTEDVKAAVKVWVVRERPKGEEGEEAEEALPRKERGEAKAEAGMEAGADDKGDTDS